MKRSVWILIFIVVLLPGCVPLDIQEETGAEQPEISTQSVEPAAAITPYQTSVQSVAPRATAVAKDIETTPAPSEETDADDDNLYTDYIVPQYIIDDAQACRTVIDDVEYYLDTDYYILQYYSPEFPLFKIVEDGWPEYMGTTGYTFQVNGDYIYVKSDVLQEDWPDGTLTRVVNLVDGSIKPVKRNIDILYQLKVISHVLLGAAQKYM